jgi:hypothetical protein
MVERNEIDNAVGVIACSGSPASRRGPQALALTQMLCATVRPGASAGTERE